MPFRQLEWFVARAQARLPEFRRRISTSTAAFEVYRRFPD
jgi:hypothetical protein